MKFYEVQNADNELFADNPLVTGIRYSILCRVTLKIRMVLTWVHFVIDTIPRVLTDKQKRT
jgi:hypothetical protein